MVLSIDSHKEKKYTHNFIALGDSKKDACCLAELGETCGMPAEQVIPVCLNNVPDIKIDQVPSIGPLRDGPAKSVYIGLWSIASSTQTEAYRKSGVRWMHNFSRCTGQRRIKQPLFA